MNMDDYIVGFVCLFIGLVVALLALSLLAEMLTPLWRKVIEGQWYSSMTVSPSVQTVSRSDTAAIFCVLNRGRNHEDQGINRSRRNLTP